MTSSPVRFVVWGVAAVVGIIGRPAASPAADVEIRFITTDVDREVAPALQAHVEAGRKTVEKFFGKPFKQSFTVEVLPGRAAFDEYVQRRWKSPPTQKWMVASGVADRLVILSPRVWKSEAVEHNPADANHIRDLVAHELVHVYHGQFNPRPDFDGMDDLGWFVEGLAVYVSGQLERSHRNAARDAIAAGKAPARLADAWSGRYRYGVSGSLVEFIDRREGREMIGKLLPAVSNDEALRILGTIEPKLLDTWKARTADR